VGSNVDAGPRTRLCVWMDGRDTKRTKQKQKTRPTGKDTHESQIRPVSPLGVGSSDASSAAVARSCADGGLVVSRADMVRRRLGLARGNLDAGGCVLDSNSLPRV